MDGEALAAEIYHGGDIWLWAEKIFARRANLDFLGWGEYAQKIRSIVGGDRKQHFKSLALDYPCEESGLFHREERPRSGASLERKLDLTHALTRDEFERAYNAVALGNWLGRGFNQWLTISWSALPECTATEAQVLFARFKKNLVERWQSEEGQGWGEPAFVYVNETGSKSWFHTHMLLAAAEADRSSAAAFRGMVRDVLRRAIRPRTWPPTTKRETKKPIHFAFMRTHHIIQSDYGSPRGMMYSQWKCLRYMMKGVNPNHSVGRMIHDGSSRFFADIMDYSYRCPGVPWSTRRVGVSESIGPRVQSQHRALGPGCFYPGFDLLLRGLVEPAVLWTDNYVARGGWVCSQSPPPRLPRRCAALVPIPPMPPRPGGPPVDGSGWPPPTSPFFGLELRL